MNHPVHPFEENERMRFFVPGTSIQALVSLACVRVHGGLSSRFRVWDSAFSFKMELPRDCNKLQHAAVLFQQPLDVGYTMKEATLDDESVNVNCLGMIAASTSGRVHTAFWDEGRKRRRRALGRSSHSFLPTGVLYVVNSSNNFAYNELEQGRRLEENVPINLQHSVSTCFEQERLGQEKSILVTTSHKLDANNMLTTHYVNNLNGGYEYTCNTSHAILGASRLSTCLHLASIGDPILEVELEQEKEAKKTSGTILANLRTGERSLKLHSKNNFKENSVLSNTYITNLRGEHLVKLEAALPLWGFANISKSFSTDFQQSHDFCFKAQRRISEQNTLKTEYITNNNQLSVELKHVAQGVSDVAVKLISNLQEGTTQFKITTSKTRQPNCWEWAFSKVLGEALSVGVEWKREVASDKLLWLKTSAQNQRWIVHAELRRPF